VPAAAFQAALIFAQTAAVPPPNEQAANVQGEVRNAIDGSPVERAHVSLQRFNNGGMDRYGALTNAEGKFTIPNIPAGNYNIMMDRVGFLDMNGPAAKNLKLSAGEKKDALKLKLTPTGTITGRVLDADGRPVEFVQVTAESGNRTERSGVTDDRGVYRIGGLRPGKYRVKAAPQEIPVPPEIRTDTTVEVHYSATYHPNALEAKSATRVLVGAATDVPGIDIHMVRTPILHISGKVAGMPAGAQNVGVSLRQSGFQGGGNGAPVRPDGSFEIWRPNPGKYIIQATHFTSGIQLTSAPVELEIGDSDIDNIALQLMAPEDIHGQVDFLDEDARNPPQPPQPPQPPAQAGGQTGPGSRPQPQPPPRRISLRNTDGSQQTPPAVIGDDGSFTLLRVQPGKYRVLISGSRVYVKSIQLGQTGMDGAVLDVRNGSGGASLSLRVASATGVVQGTVTDEKGPVAGARVALGDEAERTSAMFAMAKEDGSYTLTGVAPGKYKILVVDDADLGAISQGNNEDFEEIAESIEVADHQTVNKDLKRK
jgi:hypothetical protein